MQDYSDEYWGLALYRFSGEKLHVVFHPADYGSPITDPQIGDVTNNALIEKMKKDGIREVYTPLHSGRDFYGIPGNWISMHELGSEPEEIELWVEWQPVERDSCEYNLLAENGVTVLFYDHDRRVVLP